MMRFGDVVEPRLGSARAWLAWCCARSRAMVSLSRRARKSVDDGIR